MPCDSIITQSVNLEKCGDAKMLWAAASSLASQSIEAARWLRIDGQDYTLINGVLKGNQSYVGRIADRIKQAYSKAAIYAAAKKQNWQVKDLGNNKLQVIRRF
jgi:hypothetical protein